MGQKKSKVSELSFEGFVEYLVQHAHQYYNVHKNFFEKKKNMTAIELTNNLVDWIKNVNEERNLRLNRRHFENGGTVDPQEQQLLALLNQKVAENKDF